MNFTPTRTSALLRAEICGVGFAMAAVLLGRADLLTLAAPLLLYACLAELNRPAQFTPTVNRDQQRIPIGADSDIVVTLPEPGLIALAAPPQAGLSTAEGSPQSAAGTHNAVLAVTMQSWGKKVVGPLSIVAADLLGAWRATSRSYGPTLLAQPAARTIKADSTISSPIGTVGRHPARRPGDGSQLAGIRPYQAGDRASRINWRATSRTGHLHTNQTLMERDTQIQIVMDTSFIAGPPQAPDTVDLACEAVSTLAHHYAWLGDRVALVDLAGRIPALQFGTGRKQTRRILHTLSQLDRTTPAAKRPHLPRIRPGTLTFFCSPMMTASAEQSLTALRLSGGELAVVDTLPTDLNQHTDPFSAALRLRALQRRDTLDRIRRQGIPITTWRNENSLLPLLASLAASRGPRKTRP